MSKQTSVDVQGMNKQVKTVSAVAVVYSWPLHHDCLHQIKVTSPHISKTCLQNEHNQCGYPHVHVILLTLVPGFWDCYPLFM